MSLDAGHKLGPYEVRDQLGKGGMGEVYRARDTRLGREVAIKVLRSDRVVDEARKSRFLREARAISTLNHPSIVTLHDIATDDGIDFIVMELVPGRSLDKLIPRNGLGLQETVRIALPIAEALTRAHSAGIIHRDLKPANVMVTPEGQVKVLDFGLAKLTDSDEAVPEGPTLSDDSPSSISQPGAISGTPAYMSPEQAAGLPLDARSDIFSFGSVLYEMVTGRRAFGGGSKDETLGAVRGAEPSPPSEIVPGLPVELEKLILRCLRKDPGRRIQDMADVRVALEDVREESSSGSSRLVPAKPTRWPRAMTTAVLVVLGVLGIGLAAYWLRPAKAPDSRRPLARVTSDSGLTTDAAVSPAGNLLAYASDRAGEGHLDIWVQPLPQGEPIRLTRNPADDSSPSFSPDGSRIAFRSDRDGGGIYVVSALGGRETRIADEGRGPRFSPDGQLIAYSVGGTVLSGGLVYVVPAAGGPARQVGEQALRARNPLWSPDGRHLLCIAFPAGQDTPVWIALPIEGGAPIRTGTEESFAKARFGAGSWYQGPEAWAPDGEHVLFSARSGDTTNIWEIGLSPRTWKATGPVRQVTFGTGVMRRAAVFRNQMLVTSATENVNLWQLTLDDKSENATDPVAVTTTPGRDDWPSLSADGRWVAYLSDRSGPPGVWVTDLVNPRDIAVTLPPVTAAYPRISADGSKVAYLVPDPPPSDGKPAPTVGFLPAFQKGTLFSVALGPNGDVGVPKKLCEGCGRIWDWSADGRYLVQRATDAVLLRDSSSGESLTLFPVPNAALKGMPADPRFSPDGRWIAVTSLLGSLTRQNFVAPFRGPGLIPDADWFPVTAGTALDRQVAWSPKGDHLFFQTERDGFRCLWAQRLDPATKRAVGSPYPVHHFHGAGRSMTVAIRDPGAISVSAGGNRLVFTLGETTGNIWQMDY